MGCATCGHENLPEAAFCVGCGERIAAPPVVPVVPRRHAMPRGMGSGASWIAWWLGLGPAIAVLGALVLLPMGSLLQDEAGATLTRDATIGLAAGLGATALGAVALRALRDEKREEGLPIAVGVASLVAGLLAALLLVGAARALSRADILPGGSVEGADSVYLNVTMLGLALWLGIGVALLPGPGRGARFLAGGSFVLLLSGVALLVLSLWTIVNAGELEVAAASRERHRIPFPSLVWLVAALALGSLVARRRH